MTLAVENISRETVEGIFDGAKIGAGFLLGFFLTQVTQEALHDGYVKSDHTIPYGVLSGLVAALPKFLDADPSVSKVAMGFGMGLFARTALSAFRSPIG